MQVETNMKTINILIPFQATAASLVAMGHPKSFLDLIWTTKKVVSFSFEMNDSFLLSYFSRLCFFTMLVIILRKSVKL